MSPGRAAAPGRRPVRARAADDDFETKLAALKLSKKKPEKRQTFEERKADSKAKAAAIAAENTGSMPAMTEADWKGETVFYEGTPSGGETAINVVLGATLVWLPLTAAALGRKLWITYKITDKRVCVTTNSPFKQEELNVGYANITRCDVIGRGVGLWGDMVVTCRDGSKIEMRGIEKFLDIKEYIDARIPKPDSEYFDPMAE